MSDKSLTIVIKLGTSSICDERTYQPRISTLSALVETCHELVLAGHKVVIVSSGAIGVGMRRMDLAIERRPKRLATVQAIAAIGQCRLMALWDDLFSQLRQPIAQILLTRNDIADRTQYLNASNTMQELLSMKVIPIVNENDTISVQEIKFGDNDTLSAITAGMLHADYLFLMTDVDCLYTSNPRSDPDAKPIEIVEDIRALRANVAVNVSTMGSSLGTGGMSTKLIAAELASVAGITTIITRGSKPGNIISIVNGLSNDRASTIAPGGGAPPVAIDKNGQAEQTVPTSNGQLPRHTLSMPLHTRFLPARQPIRDRHRWILHGLHPSGTLYIDEGAFRAITKQRSRGALLSVGIKHVEGRFDQQQAVRIVYSAARTSGTGEINQEAIEIGRGVVNYSSQEIDRIKGLHSGQIEATLGYADSEAVIHRDNLAIRPDIEAFRIPGKA